MSTPEDQPITHFTTPNSPISPSKPMSASEAAIPTTPDQSRSLWGSLSPRFSWGKASMMQTIQSNKNLVAAAVKGEEATVALLLIAGADPNTPVGEDKRTALEAAAEEGNDQIVKLLLKSKAYTNCDAGKAEKNVAVALVGAAKGDHMAAVELLLDEINNALPTKARGRTRLQVAAGEGYESVVRLLLKRGVDVNEPPPSKGRTALQAASEGGHRAVVDLLLRMDADVNALPSEKSGRTALQAAAEWGHESVVKLLLEKDAEINAPPSQKSGRTALQAAAEGGHESVVKLLLERNADVNAPPSPSKGRTALQAAAAGGDVAVVKLLLEMKADVNALPSDKSGRTALQAAAERGHRPVVKLLLDRRASVNAPPSQSKGRTALQAAAERGHRTVVKLLLDRHADVNALPSKKAGRTALQAAAEMGRESVVRILLEKDANVNAEPAAVDGITALAGAAGRGHESIVELLLNAKADPNAPATGLDGMVALQTAAERGYESVVKTLLGKDANVNKKPAKFSRTTALAGGGYESVMKLLQRARADPNAPATVLGGKTAFQAAVEGGHELVLGMLLGEYASINNAPQKFGGITALARAAGRGYKSIVELLLNAKADPSVPATGVDGRTALQAAAEGGHESVVKILLEKNANDNDRPADFGGITALAGAASGGYESIVNLLLEKQVDVKAPPSRIRGRTALQAAAERGHREVVEKLLQNGANVNEEPAEFCGITALAGASRGGHESVVKILLDNKANVNERPANFSGITALAGAVKGGYKPIVELLLKAGADPNAPATGLDGRTALQVAAEKGHESVVKMLLGKDANTNADTGTVDGITALAGAAGRGHEAIVKLLLEAKANPNALATGADGRTALQAAAEGGHEFVVKMLLQNGADVNGESAKPSGITALAGASRRGYESIVKLLLENGATVDGEAMCAACSKGSISIVKSLYIKDPECILKTDRRGRTPLHSSCSHGHLHLVKWLLSPAREVSTDLKPDISIESQLDIKTESQPEVKIDPQDAEMRTPLHLAILEGREDIVSLLLGKGANPGIVDIDGLKPLDLALTTCPGVSNLLLEHGASPKGTHAHCWRSILPHKNGDILELKEVSRSDSPIGYLNSPEQESFYKKGILSSQSRSPKRYISFIPFERSLLRKEQVKTWISDTPTRYLYSELVKVRSITTDTHVPSSKIEFVWLPYYEDRSHGWNSGLPKLSRARVGDAPVIIKCSLRYHSFKFQNSIEGDDPMQPSEFRLELQDDHISWTMLATKVETKFEEKLWNNEDKDGANVKAEPGYNPPSPPEYQVRVQTMKYRSTLDHNSIPSHSLEFFDLFIDDLHKKWENILREAGAHLDNDHGKLLKDGPKKNAKTPEFLEHLFADARMWSQFRVNLESHIQICTNILDLYKGSNFFSEEVDCFRRGFKETQFSLLSGKIKALKSLEKDISALEGKTTGLVNFKLNLLQAYEAQKSNSTAAGMKRLSWITFIFLPSMFVASLFGMNVDILTGGGPVWIWYPTICIPVLLVVLFAWLACKYIDEKYKLFFQLVENLCEFLPELVDPLREFILRFMDYLRPYNPISYILKQLHERREKNKNEIRSIDDLEAGILDAPYKARLSDVWWGKPKEA